MDSENVMAGDDFQKCVAFHGHVCPGLSLGYRAAKAAMARLAENRAEDEEVVAVLETDACFADAVQVLTGCTFGKGNFVFKDYGKIALTLFSRNTGRGVRVCMRDGIFGPRDEHSALLKKVMQNEADDNERQRFGELHCNRSQEVLSMDEDRLFRIEEAITPLPPNAQMAPSKPCSRCGEPTMATKLTERDGQMLCRACLESKAG